MPPPQRSRSSRTDSAGEEMGNKMVAQALRKNATGPNSPPKHPTFLGKKSWLIISLALETSSPSFNQLSCCFPCIK